MECEPSMVDKLLKPFRDKGYDHCVLYHHVRVGKPGETEMIDDAPLIHENDSSAKELKGCDHCVLYHHVRVGQPGETEMIGDAPLIIENDSGAKELMVNETYGHIGGQF
jgi:hypothetical protein